ncbi:hypothetical protein lbkm_1519 [Lachnospiraceae bacterium KM106-2]|nr:hypothetical protein lbkm_1519 [Lachnospiraceae bacterium KM106-2]
MSYEIEEIKLSQQIFYYLLEKRELTEEKERDFYRAYTEREQVMNLVKSQAEAASCQVERYLGVIYLIPKENNDFLGYSKADLKQALCKAGAVDKDYYLSQFIILTLLVEFYDASGRSSKGRNFMKGGELLNCVGERLQEGSAMEEEKEDGLSFLAMEEAFSSLKSEDKGSHSRTTKEGFLYHILMFLQRQGLIEYIEADDMINTTKKLDHFMDWKLLNKNHYEKVLSMLGVTERE